MVVSTESTLSFGFILFFVQFWTAPPTDWYVRISNASIFLFSKYIEKNP